MGILDAPVRVPVSRIADAIPMAGLVALFDFQRDAAGGNTVTSRVGTRPITLTALGSKTVVKDGSDPGPFGASLVLDGATVFIKAGNLGPLDPSVVGDQVTVITWVKDSANNHDDGPNGLACRAGSHNDGSVPSRQYGSYFDANAPSQSKGKYTPHMSSQDGPTPNYQFSADNAATARKIFTGTGQSQWHMEAFTFDGAQIVAYIDGMTDLNLNCPEPLIGTQTAPVRSVDRNPYPMRRGINRSQTTKRFSIGASSHWDGTTDVGFAYTTGKLGGAAVFNRALSAVEIMQIRLATLLPGEAITMFGFEMSSTGDHYLGEIGWTARAQATNIDVSTLTSTGIEYSVYRPVSGQKAYLRKTVTSLSAAWGPVSGLNSAQIRNIRFKMLSAATTSAPQRVLVKVGSQWWASNTTFATTAAHASDTDWSGAEVKTLAVDWGIGNWKAVTLADAGGTATYQNLAQNPALTANVTNWFKSGGAGNATAARVSDGAGGFVYRLTWTATDAGTVSLGGLSFTGVAGIGAGSVYSASMKVNPSQHAVKLQLELIWVNSSGTTISTTDGGIVSCAAGVQTTLTVSGVAPAGATQLTIRAQSVGVSWVSGNTLDLTKCLIVQHSAVPAYFDGTTPLAAWDGTAGASTSTITGVATGVLSLSGSTNAAYIDNAVVTAVGFLSSGGDASPVRIADLELLPT